MVTRNYLGFGRLRSGDWAITKPFHSVRSYCSLTLGIGKVGKLELDEPQKDFRNGLVV